MLNIDNDFKLFDGAAPVTIIEPGPAGKQQIIHGALRFPLSNRDAIKADGAYSAGDVKFNIPAIQSHVFTPAPGCFIVEESKDVWAVGMVDTATLRTRFECWAKRATFNAALAVTVRIYRPTPRRDDSGAAYSERRLVAECLAVINEAATRFEISDNRRRVEVTHQIYTLEQIDGAESGWTIEDETGNKFNVVRVTGKGVIGEAMVFEAVAQRSPVRDE